MRKNIVWLLLIGIMAVSCTDGKKDEAGTLNDKKAELQKLKEEQKKLAGQVEALEAEIAKADPKSSVATAKLVTVMSLTTQPFSHYIELQGKVDAQNISYVAPPNGQGGVVKSLYVKQRSLSGRMY